MPASLRISHLEVGGEGAHGEPSPRTQRSSHAGQYDDIVARADEPERALAERDDSIKVALEREVAGIETLERRRGVVGCALDREVDEPLRDVDADDFDALRRHRVGVPSGTATDVEQTLAR